MNLNPKLLFRFLSSVAIFGSACLLTPNQAIAEIEATRSEQDRLTYQVSLLSLEKERDKANTINVSKSTANEQPIIAQGKKMQTWQEFVDRGGRRFFDEDYTLPDEFRNGFVYFLPGNTVSTFYIFKQGLSSYPVPLTGMPSDIDGEEGDRHVRSGQAIKFYVGVGNSQIRRLNDIEVNFDRDGQGCFREFCLTAPFMSADEISQILMSARPIGESLLLRERGRLENGDSVMRSDGSLIDRYSFAGQRGQSVKIDVTSPEFDTYLLLIDPNGKKIAENDDRFNSVTSSYIEVTLPETGTYTVVVNGYDRNSRGNYIFSLTTPEEYATDTVASNSSSPTEPDARSSCPNEMFEARVETSAEYDHQSPSYAGANHAGRNKNGRRNDGSAILPESRCLSLVEIQSPNNPEETWVIIHGWDDSPDGSLNSLAREVAKQNPGDRVLMLDWSEASNNLGDDGANPFEIHEKLSRGNYYAATWIRPVAEVTVEALKQTYGIDNATAGSKLNFIGHSLGSLLSGEISRIYKQSNGVGSNYLVALDPPSEFNVSEFSPIGTLGGYDLDGRTPAYRDVRRPSINTPAVQVLDREILPPLILTSPFETRTLITQNVERPQPFRTVSRFSRAFVGKTSFAGNQELAATAHESFQMDFGSRRDLSTSAGKEHGLVIEAFIQHVSGNSLIPGFLGLDDRQQHLDIKENAYPYNQTPFDLLNFNYVDVHEGVIDISEDNRFFAFHLESLTYGKLNFSGSEFSTEDTSSIELDEKISGHRVRVAGGSLLPPFYEIFPSILPFTNI